MHPKPITRIAAGPAAQALSNTAMLPGSCWQTPQRSRRYSTLAEWQDLRMPTADFRFEVEEAFDITGRGTGVVGHLVSGNTTSGEPLCLHADGAVLRIDEVSVEFMYKEGSDRRALMLRGVTKQQVPPGSVLLPCD